MTALVFWLTFFIVFFSYIGYGLIVFLLVKIRGKNHILDSGNDLNELPTVVHLIAAYNEEDYIDEKITNSLALSYQEGKYEVWIVTDGSTDRTPDIVRKRGVRLFHQQARLGKIHAVNRVLSEIKSEIVVFSDANTQINQKGILNIVKHFGNDKVGVVAGEKRINVDSQDEAASSGEGFYWKYESFLKKYDYYLYSTVGAAGELFAIRTNLFEVVPEDSIIEDFYLSMKIAAKGYRIAYEPNAYAIESSSESIMEESKRKIRIAAGGLQSTWRLRKLFNIFKYGWLCFQFVGHRVLRWTAAPVSLPVIFITNGILALEPNVLFRGLFLCQVGFYLLAFIGYLLQSLKIKVKVLFIPFYFVFMNWAVYSGLFRLIAGKQSVIWERAGRKKAS